MARKKDHINHRTEDDDMAKVHAIRKRQILDWLAEDEMFRNELLAALGLGLVNGELKQLEDRVTALENK